MIYIFDMDGTLRITKTGRPCPNDPTDQVLLPGVKDRLSSLKNNGDSIFACSNQGGVSCGYMSANMAWMIAAETNVLLGGVLEDIEMCFYYPDAIYSDRYKDFAKPKPEMVYMLLDNVDGDIEENKKQTVFVGNEFVDQECAKNASVNFVWAHEFFGWKEESLMRTQRGVFFIRQDGQKK